MLDTGRKALLVLPLLSVSLSVSAGVETDEIQALISEGKLRQALSLTEGQLKQDEGSVTFRFLKGLILTRLNELDKARELFVQLTLEYPELPEPYNNLAVIHASQGDFEKARDALQQAIRTHPSYATAHENMGDIYAKMASKAYNQALQLDAENTSAKAKLALVNDLFFVPQREPPVAETVAELQTHPASEAPAPESVPPSGVTETDAEAVQAQVKQDKLAVEKLPAENAAQEKKQQAKVQTAAVTETIEQWAKAWSEKDATKYVRYYGKDFTPPHKMSRVAWEAQRKVRLTKPRFIKVGVKKLQVELLGDNHARAEFRQAYQSDSYRDEVSKTLILKNVEGEWLITEELSK